MSLSFDSVPVGAAVRRNRYCLWLISNPDHKKPAFRYRYSVARVAASVCDRTLVFHR